MFDDDEQENSSLIIEEEEVTDDKILQGKSDTFIKMRKKFMMILKFKIHENLKRERSPKLQIISCNATHNTVNININSNYHGIITIIVIPYDIDKNSIISTDFSSKYELQSKFPNSKIKEYEYNDDDNEAIDIEVIQLKPETRYRCYAYILTSKPNDDGEYHYLMLDEFFQETLSEFETIEEPLEIEWYKLSR
jgi:hypothetical protein